jgi:hypothetical protein
VPLRLLLLTGGLSAPSASRPARLLLCSCCSVGGLEIWHQLMYASRALPSEGYGPRDLTFCYMF